MAIMRRITPLLGVFILSWTSFGYIRQATNITGDNSPAPLFRADNSAIQFLLNANVVPGLQSSASGKSVTVISAGSDPQAAARAALAAWNAVTTANVKFLPLQSTALGINPSDDMMVIAVGASASDLSLLGSALAVTAINYVAAAGVIN